jgi:hypothetical protein
MTTYNATIQDANGNNPVWGDTVDVTRTVTDVPAGDTLAKAWLTVKAKATDGDAAAVLQLEVTTSPTANGSITDDGADETGAVNFKILPTDYGSILAKKNYAFDIQVLTTDGVVATVAVGTVRWEQGVTEVYA